MSDSLFMFSQEQCAELALLAYSQFLAQAPLRKHIEWTEEAARTYYTGYFNAFGPDGEGKNDVHFAQFMLEEAYGRHAAKELIRELNPIAEAMLAECVDTPVRIEPKKHEESWESAMHHQKHSDGRSASHRR